MFACEQEYQFVIGYFSTADIFFFFLPHLHLSETPRITSKQQRRSFHFFVEPALLFHYFLHFSSSTFSQTKSVILNELPSGQTTLCSSKQDFLTAIVRECRLTQWPRPGPTAALFQFSILAVSYQLKLKARLNMEANKRVSSVCL